MGTQDIGVYKVYSITRVFMGTGYTWVHTIDRGIQGIQYY